MIFTKKAFTLVELIIVVAILAILAVFGFTYMSGNIKDSRDVARLSDLNSIEKALDVYEVKNGNYPLPDNYTTITYSGSELWHQGVFGDGVFRKIRILSNKPVDPLDQTQYSYSVLNSQSEYEVSTVFEGSFIASIPGIAYAHAEDKMAYLVGNYNKKFASTRQGNLSSIVALPSITSSDVNVPTLESIISNNNLVIHGKQNLPAIYNSGSYNQSGNDIFSPSNYLIFNGTKNNLTSLTQQTLFIENLQDIYGQYPHLDNSGQYKEIMGINTLNSDEVRNYFERINTQKIGGI